MTIISEAIGSNINISSSDAATTAETSVGNGSTAASRPTWRETMDI